MHSLKSFLLLFGVIVFSSSASVYASDTVENFNENKIYIVTNDTNKMQANELCSYLINANQPITFIDENSLSELKNVSHAIILNSPADKDAISSLVKSCLTPEQWEHAQLMGKSGLVMAQYHTCHLMIFSAQYGLKNMIHRTTEQWKEIFEIWYDIPIYINNIVGY